ncbi:hypothetical protein [Pseudoalteromonas sp. Angola-4]|uniref:hypothetical protein n=1 Tax=Pseudoalteromonas sp. Angola-4 TaxID=3025335 RepID=UPI00235A2D1B|nr:hypothetical protein [Pseudoalteromonas sp. Angola-4]MDC9511307.1 hypothetical protein [Pseudoalteromonas sp. Angola-4]
MNQKYEEIALEDLHLDLNNPRLPRSLQHSDTREIINWMLEDASLIELMLAIGTNGFFPGEPLLIVEEDGKNIVVEGNRRLSSLKLLKDPNIATKMKKSISRVMELTDKRPSSIPCIKFPSRNEVNKYLGFRHITGIKEWSLLAKARYLRGLIPGLGDITIENTYRELAKMIGSKADYIRRVLVALNLFDKIEEDNYYNISGLNENTLYFNYLMDSLNREHICSYIGVSPKIEDPLGLLNSESEYQENFKLLIHWFFEKNSKNKTVLLGDSRHLTMLNNVLANEKTKNYFIETNDINAAEALLFTDAISFHHKIKTAHEYLENALSESYKVDEFGETDLELLKQIKNIVTTLSSAINERKA